MKKSQTSFEYVVLFLIMLFLFISLGSFFPQIIDQIRADKEIAGTVLDNVKVKLITASLAESDFETKVEIPKQINNEDIRAEIYPEPDNIIYIKNADSGETLAKKFLPKVDAVSGSGPILTIKKISNQLVIEQSEGPDE
jgi:hypothetical protein